jgi:hypothetical protein
MIGIVYAALGVLVAMFATYGLVLAVSAFFLRIPPTSAKPRTRLTILIPAHNEAALIERCIGSLQKQTYPEELYNIAVVADNCTDATADIAASNGATVLVRDEPDTPGKGQALRWALDRILAETSAPDAVVVVDADSIANPDFLARLAGPFESGAQAVQGESLLMDGGSPGGALRSAAFLLVNRVRPAGRSVLGVSSHLAGNGMLFGRELLTHHPWNAFTSTEDLEYGLALRRAGASITFARGAILYSPAAPTAEAARHQQLRWEGGKFHLARTHVPGLVAGAFKERRPSLLGEAFELVDPPLGLLAAAAIAGSAAGAVLVSVGGAPGWTLLPWLAADTAIPLYVVVGLRAAEAPRSAYRSLVGAPLLIIGKITGVRRLLGFRGDTWVRTERESREHVRR